MRPGATYKILLNINLLNILGYCIFSISFKRLIESKSSSLRWKMKPDLFPQSLAVHFSTLSWYQTSTMASLTYKSYEIKLYISMTSYKNLILSKEFLFKLWNVFSPQGNTIQRYRGQDFNVLDLINYTWPSQQVKCSFFIISLLYLFFLFAKSRTFENNLISQCVQALYLCWK